MKSIIPLSFPTVDVLQADHHTEMSIQPPAYLHLSVSGKQLFLFSWCNIYRWLILQKYGFRSDAVHSHSCWDIHAASDWQHAAAEKSYKHFIWIIDASYILYTTYGMSHTPHPIWQVIWNFTWRRRLDRGDSVSTVMTAVFECQLDK